MKSMSFGPRKPAGPSRPTRPNVVKKPTTKTLARKEAPKLQPASKPRAPTVAPNTAPRKVTPVAPKPTVTKPPTPEPVYDYESDFESDESMPSAGCSSSDSSAENTEPSNSSSEGGDDEDEDEADEKIDLTAAVAKEAIPAPPVVEQKIQSVNTRNARSVDILSKISLNDISVDLYRFDSEEYAELRTNFGVTSTVAHGKHTQTDCGVISAASQTSGISTRERSTCMHGGHQSSYNVEEPTDCTDRGEDDEDSGVQNYSSLQNIERMFSTLNVSLERSFSNASFLRQGPVSPSIGAALCKRNGANQQRSILQLVRKAAPVMEALLESKRYRAQNTINGKRDGKVTADQLSGVRRSLSSDDRVIRLFDAGKMCPEFEVKLVHDKHADRTEQQVDRFVLEFWARGTYSRPMYRFASWSSVVCVDYEFRKHMMVFAGTSDGTLHMWLGDAGRCRSEVQAPHQIVAPNVKQKHSLSCWEMVAVKVLPVPVIRDSNFEVGNENAFSQVFALFSSGIILNWHVQVDVRRTVDGALSATLGQQEISLVQSKVIDLCCRIGGRLPYDALRSFQNLLLHDHHQMVLSSNHTVVRLSHFVQSGFDPVLLIQPDSAHSIINLKRMAHANDTLFVLYSNKTVRVLKLCADPDGGARARNRHRKYDDHPNLMLSVCTNKSCTIQSIVHDESKRYGNPNGTGEGRADGGTIALKVAELEKGDGDVFAKPRFHHGQHILFFDAQHSEDILKEAQFDGARTIILRERS